MSAKLLSVLGAIGITAIGSYGAFQLSPWPMALVLRLKLDRGGDAVAGALEQYVPSGVAARLQQRYADDPAAYLDVFYPAAVENTDQALPTVVWVHGGSWVAGRDLSGTGQAGQRGARLSPATCGSPACRSFEILPGGRFRRCADCGATGQRDQCPGGRPGHRYRTFDQAIAGARRRPALRYLRRRARQILENRRALGIFRFQRIHERSTARAVQRRAKSGSGFSRHVSLGRQCRSIGTAVPFPCRAGHATRDTGR